MAEGGPLTLQDIMTKKNEAYDAVTYFEVARRKVYRHCNLEVPAETGPGTRTAVQTRNQGTWFVLLTSSCPHCHAHHTCLGRPAYLEWYSKLPFKCDHGGVVTNMQVEPDGVVAMEYPHVYMPAALQRVDPDGVTQSSGGVTTQDKLRRDAWRLQATFGNALSLMGDLLHLSRDPRVDRERHPELATDEIHNIMTTITAQHEEAADTVKRQMDGMQRMELDFGNEAAGQLPYPEATLGDLIGSQEDMQMNRAQFNLRGSTLEEQLGYTPKQVTGIQV